MSAAKADSVIKQVLDEVAQIQRAWDRLKSLDPTSDEAAREVAVGAELTTRVLVSLTTAVSLLAERLDQHLRSGEFDHPELK